MAKEAGEQTDEREWFYCSECENVFRRGNWRNDERCSCLLYVMSEAELRTALAAIKAAKKEE